jgi:hypothetical protein
MSYLGANKYRRRSFRAPRPDRNAQGLNAPDQIVHSGPALGAAIFRVSRKPRKRAFCRPRENYAANAAKAP